MIELGHIRGGGCVTPTVGTGEGAAPGQPRAQDPGSQQEELIKLNSDRGRDLDGGGWIRGREGRLG